MNFKKLFLIMCVVLALISTISVASAGLFGFGGNPQDIGGITFNIPGDYEEVSQLDNDNLKMDFHGMKDVETKYFKYDHSDGTSIKPNQLVISVISDSDVKLDDANKFTYGEDDDKVDLDDYNETTIGDKTGYAFDTIPTDVGGGHMTGEYHEFFYDDDGKLVHVELYGWSPYVSADMIGDIIGG